VNMCSSLVEIRSLTSEIRRRKQEKRRKKKPQQQNISPSASRCRAG